MLPALMKRKKSYRKSSTSSRNHKNSKSLADEFRKACCWSAPPETAKLCSDEQLLVKRTCRSFRLADRTLSKCSSVLERRAYATCLSRERKMRRASSLSMKSMRLDAIAAPALVEGTTSVSRR